MKINLNFLKHQRRRENNIFFFLNHSETRALALGVEDPFQIYFLYRSIFCIDQNNKSIPQSLPLQLNTLISTL